MTQVIQSPAPMSDLETKIRNWLEEQGYPLEMRVACAFRRAGFRVVQSDYYKDPTTGVHREIDVVAFINKDFGDILVRIEFVIECKTTKSKPWLLFCSSDEQLAGPARVVQRPASKIASTVLRKVAQRKEIQHLGLFTISKPPAYGITQAFTTGADLAYAALSTVSAAAAAAVFEGTKSVRPRREVLKLAFPVIAIEGRLFSCVLKDDNTTDVFESKQGTVLWRNPVVSEPHTIVTLLSDAAITNFAETSSKAAADFFSLAEKEILEACALSKQLI